MTSRRFFLSLCAAAPATAQFRFARLDLHADFQSAVEGIEYFFLGNGSIVAAVQSVDRTEAGTHAGLVLTAAERFGRKHTSLLYDFRNGLRYSRPGIVIGAGAFYPEPGRARIFWKYPEGIPTVAIEWRAGDFEIMEELHCAALDAALIRDITVRNTGPRPANARVLAWLQPNSSILDEYDVDRARGILTASGYHRLRLFASGGTVAAADRSLSVDPGPLASGGAARIQVVTTLDHPETMPVIRRERTAAYWGERAALETGHAGLDHLFRCSLTGIRAAVAHSGKMDGGIWQYNLEWARDPMMVAQAAAATGSHDVARGLLERVWTHSISDDGKTVEASRTREPADMELDQNGEVLYGLWSQWAWSGDDSLVRRYWQRVRAVADYVLQPVYRDPASGLLHNRREFWERGAGHGFADGFEISYQVWNVLGLEKAAAMARLMGDAAAGHRWLEAASLMRRSMLSHPRHSLVEDGRIIKRRLLDGTAQMVVSPPDRSLLARDAPLARESVCYCDPDSTSVYPVIFEMVDPRGPVARNTLAGMEQLWNQRWTGGGYGRYHVSSEPDSPGPWPFATMFVARAYHEAGNDEKVWRVLNWMLEVQGGRGGAWFEVYGPRPAAGFPVGITPWTWAEMLLFFTHHFLGIRPDPGGLTIRPRLLRGIQHVEARLPVHGRCVRLRVDRGEPGARVDGRAVQLENGAIRLPQLRRDVTVEFSGV